MARALWMLLAAAGILAVGATAAWATGLTSFGFVGSDGTMTACVQNSNGNMRLIDPSSATKDLNSCRSNESQVVLNQKGQKGDTGAQGPPGSSSGPANVIVDCAASQSVQQALDANASATSIDITIKGTCRESVNINRDYVSLHAFSSGDGLATAASPQPVVAISGRHVQIDGLTITGGSGVGVFGGQAHLSSVSIGGGGNAISVGGAGNANVSNSTLTAANEVVHAGNGGSVQLDNVSVRGSGTGNDAIVVQAGGTVTAFGSDISGARHGVITSPGGSAEVDNTTIHDNTGSGLFAFGGAISAHGGSVTGSGEAGVSAYAGGYVDLASGIRIASNNIGVATYGGRILIQDGVVIENNTGDGLQVSSASSAAVEGPATIQNNTGNGVHISDNSVASFNSGDQITGNTRWGIFCDGPPSNPLIIGFWPVTGVSGNAAGDVNCAHA